MTVCTKGDFKKKTKIRNQRKNYPQSCISPSTYSALDELWFLRVGYVFLNQKIVGEYLIVNIFWYIYIYICTHIKINNSIREINVEHYKICSLVFKVTNLLKLKTLHLFINIFSRHYVISQTETTCRIYFL